MIASLQLLERGTIRSIKFYDRKARQQTAPAVKPVDPPYMGTRDICCHVEMTEGLVTEECNNIATNGWLCEEHSAAMTRQIKRKEISDALTMQRDFDAEVVDNVIKTDQRAIARGMRYDKAVCVPPVAIIHYLKP